MLATGLGNVRKEASAHEGVQGGFGIWSILGAALGQILIGQASQSAGIPQTFEQVRSE